MPRYIVTTADGQELPMESPEPPTQAAVDAFVAQQSAGHPYLAAAARLGLPVLGGIGGAVSPVPGGALIGGGLGAAAGERLGQWLEGRDADYKDVALQGALGAVPFVGKPASVLGGVALRGAEAAALGAGGEAARAWMHDQPITLDRLAFPAAVGAVFGGTVGGIEGRFARPPNVLAAATEPPPSLGAMGLPGAVGDVGAGALSAADPDALAPSMLAHVDTLDDVKDLMGTIATENRMAIEEARRGVQTAAQREAAARPLIAELADRLGTDPDAFSASLRKRGEALNAEQLDAMKVVFNTVADDFYTASRKAVESGDPQDLLAVAKSMAIAKGVMSQKAGATAEAGRALNALRGVQTGERLQQKVVETLLSQADTTPEQLAEVAKRAAMLDPTDMVGMTRFLREAGEVTTTKKVQEVWINGMLSNPITHIKNFIGNTAAMGARIPEEILTGGLDAMRAKLTGTPQERFAGEAWADLMGMRRGLVGGVRAALRSFQTEVPQFGGVSKLETRAFANKGALGRAIRIPSRILMASDDFFKALNVEGAMYAQAYREAAQSGAEGADRAVRMTQLLGSDRERLLQDAIPEALYRTFQSPGGAFTTAVLKLRDAPIPGTEVRPLQWVLPFVRTPINVASFAVERTPLGLLQLRNMQGGASSEAVAKVALGMGIAGAATLLAAEGKISGAGPSDRASLQTARDVGFQPYSVKVGNEWVSYRGLEPLATPLAMAASAADLMDDPLVAPDEIASRVAFGFIRYMSDQTFLQGLRMAMDAADDPDRFGGYFRQLAGSAVPAGVGGLARAMDPTVRRPQTLVEQLQARLPGASTGVLPLRNVWGEEVQRTGSMPELMLSPFARRPIPMDPASVEIRRLRETVKLTLRSPAEALTVPKDKDPLTREKPTPLTPEEYDRYTQESGQLAKQLVTRLVQAPGYQRLDDERRAAAIEKFMEKAREVTRDRFRAEVARRTLPPPPLGMVPMPRATP